MKPFLILLFTFISQLAYANDVGYEVELIIFEDKTGIYNNSENWPTDEKNTELENIVNTKIDTVKEEDTKEQSVKLTTDGPIEVTDSALFRLTPHVDKLKNHPDYNLLVHKAWKQKGLDRENAIAFEIDSRNTSSETENTSFVDGTVTLIMSRYLHFNTDLTYHKPVNPMTEIMNESDEVKTENTFPVQSERRMRSKELHYIDHPLVGVIVLATPYKIESEEETVKEYKTL